MLTSDVFVQKEPGWLPLFWCWKFSFKAPASYLLCWHESDTDHQTLENHFPKISNNCIYFILGWSSISKCLWRPVLFCHHPKTKRLQSSCENVISGRPFLPVYRADANNPPFPLNNPVLHQCYSPSYHRVLIYLSAPPFFLSSFSFTEQNHLYYNTKCMCKWKKKKKDDDLDDGNHFIYSSL